MPGNRYQVVLQALAPDATDAGSHYAETTLDAVPEEQLRKLLATFADLAARLSPTATVRPQIRIKAAAGLAMISAIEGKLYYASWDTKGRGIEVSVDDIIKIVTAPAEAPKPARVETRSASPIVRRGPMAGRKKFITVTLLGLAIVAMNAATVWMLLKPPRTILPPHVFLSDADSDALLKQVAGAYQTGNREGDRHLQIEALGLLRFTVYGQNRALRREQLQSGRAAKTVDGVVIITNEFGVLRMIGPNTVAVYGDTYRKITN